MSNQERERRTQQTVSLTQPAGAAAADTPADALAQRARSLLDLGDALIERALSGDSQRFLAQNRQHGGE